MQKSTKDLSHKKDIDKKSKVVDKPVNTTKKATSKVTKGATSKKSSTSKNKVSAQSKKKSVAKKSNSTKKATKTKSAVKSTKKVASKKLQPSKKTTSTKKSKKVDIIEYYDLPYRYNETVVKILAQTPNTLFVYWDIADSDRKKYIEKFGENFFESTVPVLIVHNKTMHYSFEIEINDFANSWYFNVNDAKCDYEIELGRRAKSVAPNINLPNNYMYVASSNTIESPNNHILFEKKQKSLFFRNVKNNNRYSKDISQFEFIQYLGRIYNIYDVYQRIYKDDDLMDLTNNPTSPIK